MGKQTFDGRLVAFAGDARDNDPFYKITIKTREESTMHPLLSTLQSDDEGIEGAYKWANSPGFGHANFTLTTPQHVNVCFDGNDLSATLVSIAMFKKATPDLGSVIEYAFNFEKTPEESDSQFWMTYLKQKEVNEAPEPGKRPPKAAPLSYGVVLTVA